MANTLSHIVFAHLAVSLKTARVVVASALLSLGSAVAADFIRCPLADGFDHAVGKPDASGYYKFRGFSPNGHMGEDWNGNGGGDSDFRDPIYAIARGVVVHAADIHVGWGNVVIIRHAFRESSGRIQIVDSLYGHLNDIKVKVNQIVERGAIIGTMGNNHGMYAVHLHLEIHKNLEMGPNRAGFAHDYSNYYSPTQFIESHRVLPGSLARVEIPINTFAPYGQTLPAASATTKTSRSLSIPVYRGSPSPTPSSRSGSASTKTTADPKLHLPAMVQPPAETEDFWSRLKSKLKSGTVTESIPVTK